MTTGHQVLLGGDVEKTMKLWFRHVVILAAIAAIGGLLVMVSGIVPIAASGGHWPVTRWGLEFSMSRSVATHSANIAVPDLSDRSLIIKGAGHFETGCVQCHGGPSRGPNPIAAALMPTPPLLADAVTAWEANELFYIVKHGVKLTGMPAWPAQDRDDEVWAVVAFLKILPDMQNDEYQSLVSADTQAADDTIPSNLRHLVTTTCGRCHGADGLGGAHHVFPVLAGQRKEYLEATLKAFADGSRHSGIMEALAVPLRKQQITELAEFYSMLASSLAKDIATPAEDAVGGEQIATQGIPSQRVPACVGCHDPDIGGSYPMLSGQPTHYLKQQLQLFKRRVRGGTMNAHLMHPATERITDSQIEAVAEYFGSSPEDESQR
ncbi:MAG: c-type cytochrome [Planctomycetaceae bacterium]